LARIALGIEVEHERAQTLGCTDRGQIAYDGGFSDTTLLIEYDSAHRIIHP
jgi:hypothetical protein